MPPARTALISAALIAAAALGFPQEAQALSLCGSLCSCTVSTNPALAFGGYDPVDNTTVTATNTVTVGCQLLSGLVSLLVPYTITLSQGQSGTFAPRQMLGPSANMLSYNLYSNSAMTAVWGDGTGSSQTVSAQITVATVGLNVNQMQTIYAQIPAGQNVKLGSYTDTITATVAY